VHFSITLVRALLTTGARFGLDMDELLAIGGLPRTALLEPTRRVPFDAAVDMIEHALATTGQPKLGLWGGLGLSSTALNIVGGLVDHAASLRQAIAIVCRYAPLFFDGSRYELVEEHEAQTASLRFTCPPTSPAAQRFLEEFTLAFSVHNGRRLFFSNDIEVLAVRFRGEPSDELDVYTEIFGCRAEFNAPHCELVFDLALLDQPLLAPDPALSALLAQRADELLAALEVAPLEQRVSTLLTGEPSLTHVSMDALATRLAMSPRTLQRRLGEAETSWSRLVEAEQRRRACLALASSDVPIKEIADHAGFAEPSTFYRAFKRWTGTTPAEFRRMHHRGPAKSP
jgi:AraC-like DNA-binding protein